MTNDVYNERVPVIQVVPITEWRVKKARIKTNVEIHPSPDNGLSKKSVADSLQTRPVDHRHRLVKIRGRLSSSKVQEIDQSLKPFENRFLSKKWDGFYYYFGLAKTIGMKMDGLYFAVLRNPGSFSL